MSEVVRYLASDLPLLLEVLRGSDVCELELEENGNRIRLHRLPSAFFAETETVPNDSEANQRSEPLTHEITSPLVGTFYRASQPEMSPFVSEGSQVQEDTVVGIVEALQVLTEVEAGFTGVVTDVRVSDGQPVEYGQVLFEVRSG